MKYHFDIDRELLVAGKPCINIRNDHGVLATAIEIKFMDGLLTFRPEARKKYGATCWLETERPFKVQFVKGGDWMDFNYEG